MKPKILFFLLLPFVLNAQNYLNSEWTRTFANPIVTEFFNSITDFEGNIYTVGNHFVASEGSNILVTKHNRSGDLMWMRSLNSINNADDIGTNIYKRDTIIFVCGFTYNSNNQTTEAIYYKLNDDGITILNVNYSSGINHRDVPVSILSDSLNNVYMLMASEQTNQNIDYLLVKNDEAGNLLWEQRYDYAGLNDYPVNLQLTAQNKVAVGGASASSTLNWDYTVCYYDSNGNLETEVRNQLPGFGLDMPNAFVKDVQGNLYITGRGYVNGQYYQAQTLKINNQSEIEWVRNYENANFGESCGNAISINDSGEVVVGGFIKDFNNDKYFLTIKYDANGEELWVKHGSAVLQKNEEIRDIKTKANNSIYVLKVKEISTTQRNVVLSKFSHDGSIAWTQSIANAENLSGFKLNIIQNDIYVSSIRDGQTKSYVIYKISEHRVSPNMVYDINNKPAIKQNELIVRFTKAAVDTNAVNDFMQGDRKIIFNDLSYWLTSEAMEAINQKFERFCIGGNASNACNLIGIKVFPNLKTTLRYTVNRLGQTIAVPDFYCTFIVEFPEQINIAMAKDSLEKLKQYIAYAEPNYIVHLNSDTLSNDAFFPNQTSLMPFEPIAEEIRPDINIEQAWRIFPQAGKPFVKVGVFDSGINFEHIDFGPYSSGNSVIKGGWSFLTASNPFLNPPNDYQNHGTPIAGIIGARRNNYFGIAGIAGGNYDPNSGNQSEGVSLYDFQLPILEASGFSGPYMGTVSYLYNGLVESTLSQQESEKGFSLNLQNLSNGARVFFTPGLGVYNALTDTNIVLLNEACRFVNKQNVVLVASRGNGGFQQPFNNNLDTPELPATTYDPWVISVGASGRNGRISHQEKIYLSNGDSLMPNSAGTSRFGSGMDLIAPGSPQEIYSTGNNGHYGEFSGTSAAAPHVSGVVAMMMSYYNQPGNNYNNLAPEDCEKIIELTCSKAADTSFYAEFEANGRLNAGKAMQLIQQPAAKIIHCNNINNTMEINSIDSTNLYSIYLAEPYQNLNQVWFSKGNYKIKRYKISFTVNHAANLSVNDSIINFWSRSSGTNLLENIEETNYAVRENIYIDSLNYQTATGYGFIYQVYDTLENPLGWWPFNQGQGNSIKIEYSILVRDTTIEDLTKVSRISQIEYKLFPNPTSSKLYIETENLINEIKVYNIYGSEIKLPFQKQGNIYKADVNELSKGVYFVSLKTNIQEFLNLKFIKQ